MTIRDGFKFGVGYFLGGLVTYAIIDIATGGLVSTLKKPTNTEDDEEKIWKPEEVTE